MGRPLKLVIALIVWVVVTAIVMAAARARDDGRYANSDLKSWFNGLHSGRGLCCSVADGRTVADPDWGTEGNHYWVRIDGKRMIVPDDAVIIEPNRAGTAIAWPMTMQDGSVTIRCFIAGGGT